jgi:hypothetical protein
MSLTEAGATSAPNTSPGGWVRTEIGGLPAYVLPSDAPARGALMFRVGRADESLPTAGLTDLVRRLALGFEDSPLPMPATVEGAITSFGFDASMVDLRSVFHELGERLRQPDLSRLDEAREGVRHEFDGRGIDEIAHVLQARFGPRGQGLSTFEPFGIDRASAEELRAWHARFFAFENAALWVVGDMPTDIDFNLVEGGERRPLSEAKALPHPYPAWVSSSNARVALSFQTLESPALDIAMSMLGGRVNEFMRERASLVQSTSTRIDALDGATSHISMLLDVVGSRSTEAISTFVTLVNRLADTRPDIREVEAARDAMLVRMQSAEWRTAQTRRAAMLELLGYAPPTIDVQAQRTAALDTPPVHDAYRAALESSVYHLPDGLDMPAESCSKIPRWSRVAVEGHEFEPAVKRREGQKLILSQAGVTITRGGSKHLTSLIKSCAGMFKWADGGREMVDATGVRVRIDPGEWIDGDAIVDALDSLVPGHRHIEKGRRLGIPEADPDRRKVPTSLARFQWTVLLAIPVVVLWGLTTALTADSTLALIAAFFIALGAGVSGYAFGRRLWRDTSVRGRNDRPEVYDSAADNFEDPNSVAMARDHQYFPGGTLLAWLVNRNLVSVSFGSTSARDVAQVRSRSMTGPEMYQKWNGLLVSDMLDEEANEFLFDYLRLEPIVRPSVDGRSGYAFSYWVDFAALGSTPPTSGSFSNSHAWNVYDRMAERLDEQFDWWKQNHKWLRVKRLVAAPPRFLPAEPTSDSPTPSKRFGLKKSG